MAVQNINTYQGNAALGQGTTSGAVGPIGASEMKNVNDAMDKLVQYDVLYRRDKWARNNLLVDRDATNAAEMMKFTIGDWLPKDRDIIMGKINKMNELYKTNPNRTRLLADGSNADAVAEFQQIANDIQGDISWANRHRAQSLALNEQYKQATDEYDKADILKWKTVSEEQTPLGQDILLAPMTAPFIPLETPQAEPIDLGPDKNGNVVTLTLPDIGAGKADYAELMSSTKGSKAREFVSKQTSDFNALLEKTREELVNKMQPGKPPTEEEILNALRGTEEGRTKLDLIARANQMIKRSNEHRVQAGFAELDEIKWIDGLSQDDYVTMLVGSNAKSVGEKVKPGGQSETEAALKEKQVAADIAQGWAVIAQRKREWQSTQEKKIDPLIKHSAIATLLSAPFQPGAGDLVDIPKNEEIKNMFRSEIPETDIEEITQGKTKEEKQSIKRKYSELEIVSVQAQKVGTDPNDTRVIVKYKNPITDEVTTNTYDRAGLNLPANNIFGTGTTAQKVAAADADWKLKHGINNPTIEQMGFKDRGIAPVSGKPGSDSNPLPLPTYMKNGVETVDSKKVKSGNTYIDKQGRKISF